MTGVHAAEADLTGADLRGARLGDAHLQVRSFGARLGGRAYAAGADLSFAHAHGVRARGLQFDNGKARNVDLSGETCGMLDLGFTRLDRADLRWADLRGALLDGATLDGAMLTGATADRRTVWPAGYPRRGDGVRVVGG